MTELSPNSYTTFAGHRRIAAGSLYANTIAARKELEDLSAGPVLIFDNTTGRSIDVDMRGTDEELAQRFAPTDLPKSQAEPFELEPEAASPRSRGRPKLGVVPREVTLLPRHWDWLASQPGGASVALRKLVEEARRARAEKDQRRQSQERAYNFMGAIGGDLPGFEEAIRALFANEAERFKELLAPWSEDVRNHAVQLAFGEHHADTSLAQ